MSPTTVATPSLPPPRAGRAARLPYTRWRLWRLVPERIEFWQGSTDRRHQRVIREL
ncbi:pyridoxine 5'-phosphate oxidase C-terminal domain-containing protein [Corynebacterium sp.]|uniref:pyridoxine 5'-phosphate oxidase C-terminal domain-containing protein n=1 Tax=Corynebacterium sp. TaxID=1720 RepID=UPI0034CD3E3B